MGQSIQQTEFARADYKNFDRRLMQNLAALEQLLARPQFGVGPGSFGAELEMYIIDKEGNALCKNQEILRVLDNPQLTLELNRFNLEYNLSPFAINNLPFTESENELLRAVKQVRRF